MMPLQSLECLDKQSTDLSYLDKENNMNLVQQASFVKLKLLRLPASWSCRLLLATTMTMLATQILVLTILFLSRFS